MHKTPAIRPTGRPPMPSRPRLSLLRSYSRTFRNSISATLRNLFLTESILAIGVLCRDENGGGDLPPRASRVGGTPGRWLPTLRLAFLAVTAPVAVAGTAAAFVVPRGLDGRAMGSVGAVTAVLR